MESRNIGWNVSRNLSVLWFVHLGSHNISVVVLLGKFMENMTKTVPTTGHAIIGDLSFHQNVTRQRVFICIFLFVLCLKDKVILSN